MEIGGAFHHRVWGRVQHVGQTGRAALWRIYRLVFESGSMASLGVLPRRFPYLCISHIFAVIGI